MYPTIPDRSILDLTYSSFLVALLMVCLLILFLSYQVSTNKKKLYEIDLISVILSCIVLRLMFPLEPIYSVTINFGIVMNVVRETFIYELPNGHTVLDVLKTVWIIGAIGSMILLVLNYVWTSIMFLNIRKNSEYRETAEYLEDKRQNYMMIFSEKIPHPMVFSIRKEIYIPHEMAEFEDLRQILQHEIAHIEGNDGWINLGINILVCIYWWFIPIYHFRKLVHLFLELRADEKVTVHMSDLEKLYYEKMLIELEKTIAVNSAKHISNYASSFIAENDKILLYRINYIDHARIQKHTHLFYVVVLIGLTFLSSFIIFEPYYPNSELIHDTYSTEQVTDSENYIIHHSDGTYTLYVEGIGDIGKIQYPFSEEIKDLKVVEEE